MTTLAERHCVSCRGGLPRLDQAALSAGLGELPGWTLADEGTRLGRRFKFADFVEAMRFVNAMAGVAEAEGHHPDFTVHWNTVDVTLWTHDAGGLTENDLVLAARVGALPEARGRA
jgi:4a-hydroxytetrahydrobiopterin dehydratase